jgi:hypothetical protein
MKIAKRKLNHLTQVKAYACMVESEEQMRLMQNQMQMAESCAHIDAINKKAKDSKQKDFEGKLLAAAPEAKTKLATNHKMPSKMTSRKPSKKPSRKPSKQQSKKPSRKPSSQPSKKTIVASKARNLVVSQARNLVASQASNLVASRRAGKRSL